jgi:hypothetical protein
MFPGRQVAENNPAHHLENVNLKLLSRQAGKLHEMKSEITNNGKKISVNS